MRQVKRSAYISYTSEQMFLLVDDVDSYANFLPWCKGTQIHERSDKNLSATIELSKGGVSTKFTTLNTMNQFKSIDLFLQDGPFDYFEGGWRFDDLGSNGSKIQFELKFKFRSSILDMSLGPFFESICDDLVNAFVLRAQEIYD
ncbi:MAG: type II toxin-antitoxin system RatA family toxin [Woeseiaceae bacterium]|jgi:ribosome-associated toxin RatA of RatAB toxin-antitoxin module|nr:type II toxin-antitoxin system RatA family toxin [Woeseiaceae bacterium]|tara:strand:- start:523 stop:954 length:432 start_codon:yes stop_codon:yes gene_type:complete